MANYTALCVVQKVKGVNKEPWTAIAQKYITMSNNNNNNEIFIKCKPLVYIPEFGALYKEKKRLR